MPNDLLKAPGGTLDVGIDEFSSDVSPEINLDFDSQNLTSGLYRGIGPRVGMQTLPGHADNEALGAAACNSMRQAEEDYGANKTRSIYRRYNLYNIFPIKIGSYEDIDVEETVYAWLISSQGRNTAATFQPGTTNLSLVLNSTYSPYVANPVPQQFPYTSDFRDGFHVPQGYGMSAGNQYQDTKLLPWIATQLLVQTTGNASSYIKGQGADDLLNIAENTFYVNAISVSFSGRNVPCQFLVGDTTGSTASAAAPPKINFWKFYANSGAFYYGRYNNGCVSSSFQKGNYVTSGRNVKIYTFGSQTIAGRYTEFVNAYNVRCDDVDGAFSPVWNYLDAGGTNYHADFTNLVKNQVTEIFGPIGSRATIGAAMLQDDQGFTNTAFRAVLAAPNKAIAWLIQDWLRSPEGMLPQVVDVANHSFRTPVGIAGTPSASRYSENGIPVATSFAAWPDYFQDTPMVAAYGVSLTTVAGSGIFRANSTYELGYSFYNKRLDFETNVGVPVKFRTDATDFVALQLTDTTGASRGGQPRYTQSESTGIMFWEFGPELGGQQTPNILCLELNMTEIRFYYRRFGSFEWLPALFVDAAKWWFYPFYIDPTPVAGTGLVIGETPIAGLPGGQPGGFIDNSRLPDAPYNGVLSFQDRIWWFSSESVFFSLRNNMFVYPVRNSISCRTGNFEGGLVHNYPGQAQQSSRLLIFGTKEVYVARFTGNLFTSPVQVSDNTVGEYPVDASDLVIDTWTTNTAFSFRSAIVAEGLAYWWGPTGVYRDNGVETPKKISLRLEPRILELYDPSDVKNIHCSYDTTAKEITWYYKPRNADASETHALTWNLIDEEWLPQVFGGIVDTVFPVEIKTDMANSGARAIMVSRAARTDVVSRGYFYDAKNHGFADIYPQRDWVIKEISTPVTGQRRLTLAAGYNAVNFATMIPGNLIAVKNVASYAPTLTVSDMLAQVVAVNTVSGYLDIRIPTGAVIDAAAVLTQKTYFPIWQKERQGPGLNGFVWRIKTKYWLPFGINFFGNWLWLYLLHKLALVKNDSTESYVIGYRTPTSGDFVYDEVTYRDNSDGNWQLYHALRTAETNNQGQAIKFDFAGIQIASDLVIQFIELHGTEQTGNDLKQFEG